MSAERPKLAALAERLGIASSYWDLVGNARPTQDATREALVAAMGFDGADELAAAHALDEVERREAESLVEPVRVGARELLERARGSGFVGRVEAHRGDQRLARRIRARTRVAHEVPVGRRDAQSRGELGEPRAFRAHARSRNASSTNECGASAS